MKKKRREKKKHYYIVLLVHGLVLRLQESSVPWRVDLSIGSSLSRLLYFFFSFSFTLQCVLLIRLNTPGIRTKNGEILRLSRVVYQSRQGFRRNMQASKRMGRSTSVLLKASAALTEKRF